MDRNIDKEKILRCFIRYHAFAVSLLEVSHLYMTFDFLMKSIFEFLFYHKNLKENKRKYSIPMHLVEPWYLY